MFSGIGYVLFLLFALIPFIGSVPASRRLSEYISHYEPLEYDASALHEQHVRARRSTDAPTDLRLTFRAHGRRFHLRLRRDLSAFHEDFQVEGAQGQKNNVDTSRIYHGELAAEAPPPPRRFSPWLFTSSCVSRTMDPMRLQHKDSRIYMSSVDDPQSKVFGSVTEGVFEGKIIASDGSFYVEHARRYFPPNSTRTRVHSVIYREGDVSDPYAHRRHGTVAGCGLTDEVMQWMDRIQNSGVDDDPATFLQPSRLWDTQYDKYSRVANGGGNRLRARRSIFNNGKTCALFVRTDPTLWRHIKGQNPDHLDPSKKDKVDTKTREELVSLIAHHVTAVNYIYGRTKFDGRVEHRNIKFEVQRIKIDDSECNPHQETNEFCQENITLSDFLHLHSSSDHEDFCLAYVFTYRDFTEGNLGLAWVASAQSSGGICEKRKTYTKVVDGMYQSAKMSLNTGFITFVNYNSRVPPRVSQLMLAHMIGHNFGSQHDYPSECRPGGERGNFIMFSSATNGDRPNNSMFSPCSIGNISQVLDAIHDGRKRNCLRSSRGSFCGNTIVEPGEECDCGYNDVECKDRCCYPRIVSYYDREKNVTAKGCTRRAMTQCSPSQGPCCSSSTCMFVSESAEQTCHEASECSHASTCSGRSAECPGPTPMANRTLCNNGTQVCTNGECSGSVCTAWDMKECFLSSPPTSVADGLTAVVDRRALCQLACQTGPEPDSCRSTADFADRVGLPRGGISLRPGSPCDNFQGYCDTSLQCRPVAAPKYT